MYTYRPNGWWLPERQHTDSSIRESLQRHGLRLEYWMVKWSIKFWPSEHNGKSSYYVHLRAYLCYVYTSYTGLFRVCMVTSGAGRCVVQGSELLARFHGNAYRIHGWEILNRHRLDAYSWDFESRHVLAGARESIVDDITHLSSLIRHTNVAVAQSEWKACDVLNAGTITEIHDKA